ncbi:hypothetical protein H8E77_43900 [bacterium]|nr:hypothetical protein [bacterium]
MAAGKLQKESCFTLDDQHNLVFYDSNMEVQTSYSYSYNIADLAVGDGYIYLATDEGLVILEASDMWSINEVAVYTDCYPEAGMDAVAEYTQIDYSDNVLVANGLQWMFYNSPEGPRQRKFLFALNLEIPEEPEYVFWERRNNYDSSKLLLDNGVCVVTGITTNSSYYYINIFDAQTWERTVSRVTSWYYSAPRCASISSSALWTSFSFIDTQRSLFEARSNASGLTPPRWL